MTNTLTTEPAYKQHPVSMSCVAIVHWSALCSACIGIRIKYCKFIIIEVMAIITVPKLLRDKLGEDGSEALVNLINQQSDFVKGDVIKIAEEKFERRLVEETGKLDSRITEEVSKLDSRITDEGSKMDRRMRELEKRLTKERSEERREGKV